MELQYPGFIIYYIDGADHMLFHSWHVEKSTVDTAVEKIKELGYDALIVRGWRA